MPVTEKAEQRVSLAHQRGVDGLRGVAVILVIIFHSGLGWLPGGFLGVSAFFHTLRVFDHLTVNQRM